MAEQNHYYLPHGDVSHHSPQARRYDEDKEGGEDIPTPYQFAEHFNVSKIRGRQPRSPIFSEWRHGDTEVPSVNARNFDTSFGELSISEGKQQRRSSQLPVQASSSALPTTPTHAQPRVHSQNQPHLENKPAYRSHPRPQLRSRSQRHPHPQPESSPRLSPPSQDPRITNIVLQQIRSISHHFEALVAASNGRTTITTTIEICDESPERKVWTASIVKDGSRLEVSENGGRDEDEGGGEV